MKERLFIAQRALNNLNYPCDENGKRDRKTIEALKQLQKDNGITPNAVICQKTFDALYDGIIE